MQYLSAPTVTGVPALSVPVHHISDVSPLVFTGGLASTMATCTRLQAEIYLAEAGFGGHTMPSRSSLKNQHLQCHSILLPLHLRVTGRILEHPRWAVNDCHLYDEACTHTGTHLHRHDGIRRRLLAVHHVRHRLQPRLR